MKSFYHVIIAGGSGYRFWPKSRKNTPKQLLKIINNKTMIRLTYERLEKISSPNQIFIVTSKNLCINIQNELPEIPKNNYIVEPSGKNTAPAIGLAALHILKKDENAIMGIYPADHLIKGDKKFQDTINKAKTMLMKKSCLITIGIKPIYAATGYGYVHYDKLMKTKISNVFKVKKFSEKPTKNLAEKNFNI